jgi:hypothetical protein
MGKGEVMAAKRLDLDTFISGSACSSQYVEPTSTGSLSEHDSKQGGVPIAVEIAAPLPVIQ